MTPNVETVAALVWNDKGQLLAVSRKFDQENLGLPGGKIEDGETPEDAIKREIWEETDLHVKRFKPVYAAPEGGLMCLIFAVEVWEGVPRDKEGAWVGWINPSRLLDPRNSFMQYYAKMFEILRLGDADS